jgi:hypothetical protein
VRCPQGAAEESTGAQATAGLGLPIDWLVTIDPDGGTSVEPGDNAGGSGASARAGPSPDGHDPVGDCPPQQGGLRGGFLPDDAAQPGPGSGLGSCAGTPANRGGRAGGAGSPAGGERGGGGAAGGGGDAAGGGGGAAGGGGRAAGGGARELHPGVAARLDAALAQIGGAREALGEGPVLAGVSAGRIQSGAPACAQALAACARARMLSARVGEHGCRIDTLASTLAESSCRRLVYMRPSSRQRLPVQRVPARVALRLLGQHRRAGESAV